MSDLTDRTDVEDGASCVWVVSQLICADCGWEVTIRLPVALSESADTLDNVKKQASGLARRGMRNHRRNHE